MNMSSFNVKILKFRQNNFQIIIINDISGYVNVTNYIRYLVSFLIFLSYLL